MTWKSAVREFIPPIVIRALRPLRKPAQPIALSDRVYSSAPEVVAAAQAAGLGVSDYVERLLGGDGTVTASRIERVRNFGAISSSTKTIVEIGAGTGRYMEATLKVCSPDLYQVYEIDPGWSAWLAKTYRAPVEVCPADGQSLKSTRAGSCDLVHGYGVFIQLPFLNAMRYFKEMVRVLAPGGFAAFDIFTERCMDAETVETWLTGEHNYHCVLPDVYVKEFFANSNFRFVGSFLQPMGPPVADHPGRSEYMIFQKSAVS